MQLCFDGIPTFRAKFHAVKKWYAVRCLNHVLLVRNEPSTRQRFQSRFETKTYAISILTWLFVPRWFRTRLGWFQIFGNTGNDVLDFVGDGDSLDKIWVGGGQRGQTWQISQNKLTLQLLNYADVYRFSQQWRVSFALFVVWINPGARASKYGLRMLRGRCRTQLLLYQLDPMGCGNGCGFTWNKRRPSAQIQIPAWKLQPQHGHATQRMWWQTAWPSIPHLNFVMIAVPNAVGWPFVWRFVIRFQHSRHCTENKYIR